MSDYGSDWDYETIGKLCPEDASDYGSEFEEDTVEDLIAKAQISALARHNIATQEDSPLLRLPPELRNLIYEHALHGTVVTLREHQLSKVPGVLLACKQTYGEATAIFYTTASFTVEDDWVMLHRLSRMPYRYQRLINTISILTTQKWRGIKHLSPEPPPDVLAEYAQEDIDAAKRTLRLDSSITIRPTVVQASIKTPSGKTVFSTTPKETYRALNTAERAKAAVAYMKKRNRARSNGEDHLAMGNDAGESEV